MIRNFFKPVDSRRHFINLLVDDLNFDAQVARNKEEIESRQTAKRTRSAESRSPATTELEWRLKEREWKEQNLN